MFKKFFMTALLAVAIIFVGNNFASAADVWLYTDKNNSQYYLRDCSLPARSWSFAHVVKVSGKNVTHLAYRFEMVDNIHYQVCYGTEPMDIINANYWIDEGTISNSPVAYKIWHNYLKQMEDERWARINANERGLR